MQVIKIEMFDSNNKPLPVTGDFDTYYVPISEDYGDEVDNKYNQFIDDIITGDVAPGTRLVLEFVEMSPEEFGNLGEE